MTVCPSRKSWCVAVVRLNINAVVAHVGELFPSNRFSSA